MESMKLEEMSLELESLRAKIRFLTDEAAWINQAIRGKRLEVEYHEKNPRAIFKSHRAGAPENQDRDCISPLKQAIAALETKRDLVLARLAESQEEMSALSTLLDKCRRHVDVANPENHVSVVGNTKGLELGYELGYR